MQPQWRVREGDFQSVGGYDLESWKRILRALCTIASEDTCLGFLKSSRTAAVPALGVNSIKFDNLIQFDLLGCFSIIQACECDYDQYSAKYLCSAEHPVSTDTTPRCLRLSIARLRTSPQTKLSQGKIVVSGASNCFPSTAQYGLSSVDC